VAGLARRIHDGSTLKEKFDKLVQNDENLAGSKTALDRRVPTRWNSDFSCLDAHVHFKNVIQQLTGVAANKLQAYRLTNPQWEMADELLEVLEVRACTLEFSARNADPTNPFLEIFDGPTKLFSESQVPIIADAVPMLEKIEASMIQVRDAADELPAVICVAAQATLFLIDKYFLLTDDCELYKIAIGKP
jgi:hypothetical protein